MPKTKKERTIKSEALPYVRHELKKPGDLLRSLSATYTFINPNTGMQESSSTDPDCYSGDQRTAREDGILATLPFTGYALDIRATRLGMPSLCAREIIGGCAPNEHALNPSAFPPRPEPGIIPQSFAITGPDDPRYGFFNSRVEEFSAKTLTAPEAESSAEAPAAPKAESPAEASAAPEAESSAPHIS